jgi:FkbM family methyltransferase
LNDQDGRIDCVNAAIGQEVGVVQIELSETNSGDHRIRVSNEPGEYDESRRKTTVVRMTRLDDVLASHAVDPHDVGLLWIDTQGYEGHVLASASNLLKQGTPAIVEYWPYGARRAASLDLFHSVVSESYSLVIDVRTGEVRRAQDVGAFEQQYPQRSYTDLALLRE